MAVDPETLTDIQRAARFLYLQKSAFGGKVAGRNFGVEPLGSGASFDPVKLAHELPLIAERLSGVVVERLPWERFLPRYDRPGVLFYLDPPYFGCEDDYGPGVFGRDDFARLAEALRGLQGRFLLSLNDRPEVREIFDGFAFEEVGVTYHLQGGGKAARELIISG